MTMNTSISNNINRTMSARPYTPEQIDRDTTLCLACSGSLPPFKEDNSRWISLPSTPTHPLSPPHSPSLRDDVRCSPWFSDPRHMSLHDTDIHITPCCQKPICPSCIASNPRLKRYDPCLACLGGVDVVGARSSAPPKDRDREEINRRREIRNMDGGIEDADTFVVGDDEEDGCEEGMGIASVTEEILPSDGSLPNYQLDSGNTGVPYAPPKAPSDGNAKGGTTSAPFDVHQMNSPALEPELKEGLNVPRKYYLTKRDTLQGIALRFGVDGRQLCRLNNLPSSVLTTTPHLLHTRAYITLPPSSKQVIGGGHDLSEEELKQIEARRVRERAEKKLQTLMKEVDWRVAKAYVSLADDEEQQEESRRKRKETDITGISVQETDSSSSLEATAIEQYLDDEEWEAQERRQGRGVYLPALEFPVAAQRVQEKGDSWFDGQRGRWRLWK